MLNGISSDTPHHTWQSRFYDFNLWSQRKEIEKLKYMHRNPVVRGLVQEPEHWRWSSYRILVRMGKLGWFASMIGVGGISPGKKIHYR